MPWKPLARGVGACMRAQALFFNHLYDPISLVRDNEVKAAMMALSGALPELQRRRAVRALGGARGGWAAHDQLRLLLVTVRGRVCCHMHSPFLCPWV